MQIFSTFFLKIVHNRLRNFGCAEVTWHSEEKTNGFVLFFTIDCATLAAPKLLGSRKKKQMALFCSSLVYS